MTAVASLEPGEDIPFYVPHMRGAGAPYWDAQSRGAFVGLTSNHGRRELMRSIIEGLCFELRILLTAVANAFDYPPTSLLTVGGGAKNEVWQQIKADVTGLTVEIPDVHDGTAQGAALIAAVGIGIYGDLTEASRAVFKVKKKFEPRREKTAYYDEIFEEYRQIYPSLKKISSHISERNSR